MEIIRGDTKDIRFKRVRKSTGETITEKPEKLYFTVKKILPR